MIRFRRRFKPPVDPRAARGPTNTEAAIDHVVTVAGCEVTRTLREEGVPPARATARDILRSRYPSDTFDDEAITEPNSESPFAPFEPEPPPRRARAGAIDTPSLSPVSISARPRPIDRIDSTSAAPAAAPITTQATAPPRERRPAPRQLVSYVRAAVWLLMLMLLGVLAGIGTVLIARDPSRSPASSPPAPAAALPDAAPLPIAPASAPPGPSARSRAPGNPEDEVLP